MAPCCRRACAGSLCRPFFFFQAEDGKRDLTVTGVQTCALPISWESCRERGTMRDLGSRRQETSGRGFEPLRDRDRLLRRLALTQDHLLMPLRRGPEVIDGGEREALDEAPQVLEIHAACSTALPAR